MRNKQSGLIAAAVMLAGCASADLIPRQDYSSDVSKPTVSKALTFRQATSQNLGWTYKQGATAKDLTGATLITFTYVPYDRAWSQVVTGALDVATNGSILVTFTPAQLNTNSGARPFDWLLEVTDGTYVLGYSYGKLTLLADPTSGVTNTFPTVTTTVDWADVAAYTATAASGPVRPGTGITSTDNADGSITFSSASGTDTTFTNYFSFTGPGTFTGDPGSGSNTLIQILSDFTSLGLYPSSNPSNFMTETEANSLYDPIGSAAAVSNAAAATYLKTVIDSDVNMGGNSLTNVNDLTYDSGWRLNDAGTGELQWSFGMALYSVWHSGNDGTGSGLDADTLDGNDSTAFSLDGHNHDTLYDPIGSAAAVSNAAAVTYLPAVAGTASNLTINGWVKNTSNSGLTIGDASGNPAIDIIAAGSGYPAVKWNQIGSLRGRLQYHHAYGSLRFDSGSKYVFSDGNVGIKTESPGYELDVTGRGHFTSNVVVDGTITLNNNGSNWVHAAGTYNGTNGVYWVTGTTTNWLLF